MFLIMESTQCMNCYYFEKMEDNIFKKKLFRRKTEKGDLNGKILKLYCKIKCVFRELYSDATLGVNNNI